MHLMANRVFITGDTHGPRSMHRLSSKPFTTAFIDGNHENFELLGEYPTKEWMGGTVQELRKSDCSLNLICDNALPREREIVASMDFYGNWGL